MQDVGGTQAADGKAISAEALRETYDVLLGHGFQKDDVEAAMQALGQPSQDAALDWLCINIPPDRLPSRFAGMTVALSIPRMCLPCFQLRPAQI